MTVDPSLLSNWDHTVPVRCADCLWWGVSEKGYRCDFDGEIVTRATARSRVHPCPYFLDRDQYLMVLHDRIVKELSRPVE